MPFEENFIWKLVNLFKHVDNSWCLVHLQIVIFIIQWYCRFRLKTYLAFFWSTVTTVNTLIYVLLCVLILIMWKPVITNTNRKKNIHNRNIMMPKIFILAQSKYSFISNSTIGKWWVEIKERERHGTTFNKGPQLTFNLEHCSSWTAH